MQPRFPYWIHLLPFLWFLLVWLCFYRFTGELLNSAAQLKSQ